MRTRGPAEHSLNAPRLLPVDWTTSGELSVSRETACAVSRETGATPHPGRQLPAAFREMGHPRTALLGAPAHGDTGTGARHAGT
ncbi:hypothetical protein GCM10010211_24900 [Streptomyces albospinus]|uniref:Uncharacterized protein n=1 Tax=Streptomyces albospinus TaxID=285515 RepID=A0ABQ2V0K8_9ACTN|nr:hypothetical protein GCM10010211_24900 [Streptomyces albospinus]